MAITQTHYSHLHWNYFLALEHDLETVARYIEFCPANFPVYSVELARLLFAAASEVDVLAKVLCTLLAPLSSPRNIIEYATIITQQLPSLASETVFLPRFALHFQPWNNGLTPKPPFWWRGYNNVKHQRDAHFHEATLQNALNAMGGLLVMLFFVQRQQLAMQPGQIPNSKDVTRALNPASSLLRLDDDYYYKNLIVG